MRRAAVLVVSTVAVMVAGAGLAAAVDLYRYRDRIYPNVYVGGLPVAGMTEAEARGALSVHLAPRLSEPVSLRAGSRRWPVVPAAVGARFDVAGAVRQAYMVVRTGGVLERARARLALRTTPVMVPVALSLDAGAARAVLKGIADAVQVEPEPARLVVEGGRVVVGPSRDGVRLDLDHSVAALEGAIRTAQREVDAAVTVRRPAFTTEAAEALGITAPVAAFSTRVSGDANRLHNVALAASRLRGVLLAPGGTFSYNAVVGPRTREAGFREAPILIDDELVPGDGGGVCQVSSTLFNVLLLSDLQILGRTNHSRPVAYLPMGRDATVVYGAIDLRARNATGEALLLWAHVRGRRLTIVAYGRPRPGREVRVAATAVEVLPPPDGTVTKPDPRLPIGQTKEVQAAPGYRVITVRQVYQNGVLVRSEVVARSVYRPVRHTIKIGSAPLSEVTTP